MRAFLLAICVQLLCACHLVGVGDPFGGKTLYERIGGVNHISILVDEFVDKLASDEVIMSNSAVAEASERMPLAPLKYHITSLVCYATGGPERYTGRTLEVAHEGLDISEREWRRSIELLIRTMESLSIGEREQSELLALVESTRPAIVGK